MEDYKEKYENLIEQLKKAKEEYGGYTFSSVVDKIVPELKESEDERIRKALIDYFRWNPNSQLLNEFTNREVFAWLEKQGEQKPAWSEEDEKMLEDTISCLSAYQSPDISKGLCYQEQIDWLKSLKPNHWKPSDEQMKHLKSISVGWHPNLDDCRILSSLYNDLLNL